MTTSSADPIEQARLSSLRGLSLMDTPAEERFDRITRVARELFDMPIAAVNLLDESRLFTKSPQRPGRSDILREDSFCTVAIQTPEILVVPDTSSDSRFSDLPGAVDAGVRFYAGRPLSVDAGNRVGTLCLFDTRPRELTPEQLWQLDELGMWAERELQDSADGDRARAVQQALLPSASPGAPLYEVAGICLPKQAVGGDFYFWQESDGSLDLVIADAMGKGTSAALIATTVRAAVLGAGGSSPKSVLDRASDALENDLASTASFATAFLAKLDPASGALEYVDAGHGLTIILARDGTYRRLHGCGLPLGIGASGSWRAEKTILEDGETLVTFTDGLLDLFGGTLSALDSIVGLVRGKAPSEVVAVLQALVRSGRQDDDITAVVLARTGTAS